MSVGAWAECDVVDEMVDGEVCVKRMYGFELSDSPSGVYDAVVIAVAHECYRVWRR